MKGGGGGEEEEAAASAVIAVVTCRRCGSIGVFAVLVVDVISAALVES